MTYLPQLPHLPAVDTPNAPAIIQDNDTTTYRQLEDRVRRTARNLRAQEVQTGDHVGLFIEDKHTLTILLLALWRIGAVAAPISLRTPPPQLPHYATQSQWDLLITDSEKVTNLTNLPETPVYPPASFENAREGTDTRTHIPPNASANRHATIIFTSGTTGQPRPAVHTFGNHYFNAVGSNQNIPLGPGHIWLLSLPLYHVGGIAVLFRCFLAGAAIAIPENEIPLAENPLTRRATHLSVVPIQLRQLLAEHERKSFDHLETILVGGGPIPTPLIQNAHEAGLPVRPTYGCTEMSSQITTARSSADRASLSTAGQVLPYRAVRIASNDEILVRGRVLFSGYFDGDSGAIHRPDQYGWFPTGDRGYLDRHGRLHVRGRKDNMFISGGENIQPEEVEDALETLPAIRRAVVVDVPDDTYGRRPVAFVQWTGEARTVMQIRTDLEDELPAFKIPDYLMAWPAEMSRSHSGLKVNRDWLRKKARQETRP